MNHAYYNKLKKTDTYTSHNNPKSMSKKRSFLLKYSIIENEVEYPRELVVKQVVNKIQAENKLRALCSTEIVITSNTEIQ